MSGEMSKYFSVAGGRRSKHKTVPVVIEYENIKKEPEKEEDAVNALKDESDGGVDKKARWEPANWIKVLANIKKMRGEEDAPVDTMGCHKCHDEDEVSPQTQRFQMLVALMLSSQTKDQVTHAAMLRLRKVGLSTKSVIEMPDDTLGELIKPVGFWRKKVGYLKNTAKILESEYNGDIPDSADKLCQLPGVGPKMAHLTMMTAWNQITGIAVDTHVHRICNRLGWVRKPTTQPTKTMQELESWLPSEHWRTINHLLVGFGQTQCKPVNPNCDSCLNNDLCPGAVVAKRKAAKKIV